MNDSSETQINVYKYGTSSGYAEIKVPELVLAAIHNLSVKQGSSLAEVQECISRIQGDDSASLKRDVTEALYQGIHCGMLSYNNGKFMSNIPEYYSLPINEERIKLLRSITESYSCERTGTHKTPYRKFVDEVSCSQRPMKSCGHSHRKLLRKLIHSPPEKKRSPKQLQVVKKHPGVKKNLFKKHLVKKYPVVKKHPFGSGKKNRRNKSSITKKINSTIKKKLDAVMKRRQSGARKQKAKEHPRKAPTQEKQLPECSQEERNNEEQENNSIDISLTTGDSFQPKLGDEANENLSAPLHDEAETME